MVAAVLYGAGVVERGRRDGAEKTVYKPQRPWPRRVESR